MEGSGLLSEHEAPAKDNPNVEVYQPTEEEKKSLRKARKLFEKARRHRAMYDEKWLDFYKMFRGKQWKEQRPTYRHAEVINLVFQNIQSQVPIETDAQPKFEFLPQEPSDREFADIMNDLALADWQRNNWGYQFNEVIYDKNIYGTGISCLKFNPKLNKGAGGIEYESSDPFYFFPDPSAYDVNLRSNYCAYAEPLDVAVIKREYPKFAKFIKPDLVDLLKGSKTDLGPMRFRSPVDNKVTLEGSSTQDYADKDMALKVTVYLKDDEYIEEQEDKTDPMTGAVTTSYLQKLKYPNGRKIVYCGNVLLEDGPNPYEDGEFPYQKVVNYILPREFWGISEVEQLEGPQKTFNKLVSFALDVLTLMGNPIWKVHANSGVDTDNLINRPGLVVEWDGETEPKREEGVQLQPYVLQLIDRMKEWFDQVGGSNDITRGLNPSGVTAASAIADLQNAAQTRIRQKSRLNDYYLQNLGKQYQSRVLQFYTAPQVFRITGKDGAQRYFKFHVSRDEMGQAYGNVQPYDETGAIADIKQVPIKGEMDVRVTTGSSLPFSKAEKEQKLLNFFDRGIVDAQEVLKATDYPNWEAVLQRVQEKQMADAQMAAQGAAPQGNPPPQG